jgi:preprotein translocase subunit SecE
MTSNILLVVGVVGTVLVICILFDMLINKLFTGYWLNK